MLKTMLQQLRQCEKEVAESLVQVSNLKMKISEAIGMDEKDDFNITQVPFAAYEMQLERNLEEKKEIEERHLKEKEQIHDRHEKEKDKMRKHYRNIILWIAIPFLTFIVAVFGTVAWFLNTYDIMTYTQDATYGNANFIGNDGDITNGEADYNLGKAPTP